MWLKTSATVRRTRSFDSRLAIKSDGDDHHYCLSCAQKFLEADIVNPRRMLDEIEALRVSVS